ncbi:MAG: class I SAM-dependent methyltransferase [Lachnospiraceae bacterium]|nr:class I SAM-dependent methyltransferase [Lachnospiraceae bacterium]
MSEEKIGNVILDLTYYKGTDAYSDGEQVEDRLLDIVKSGQSIDERLASGNDWAELYHLSEIRKNILAWADIDKEASALEIGSGCGAVTGVLCEKCGSVTCVDLSKKRSTINAYRNKDHDNLRIMVGNFEDVRFSEKYDVITLIGVFEYSIYYISSDDPFVDMLKKCRSLLKEGGKLYIAIENKYGMKYFAGASEDHTGIPFDGIEGYHGVERVRTFSGYALTGMLKKAGFSCVEFRYPVPDYKLPLEIYSDDRLPSPGEITHRSPNFDRERMDSFDEVKVTDQVCADGLFPDFSNSFLITAHNGGQKPENGCLYAKFNTLRAPEYRVDTRIVLEDGRLYAVKSPSCLEAESHIDEIEKNAKCSADIYKTIKVPGVARKGRELFFDFVSGVPFDSDCIDYSSASVEDICSDLKTHLDKLLNDISDENRCGFKMTDEFGEMFAGVTIPEGIPAFRQSNADMIFSNFLKADDGLYCIDPEWFFTFPVPEDFLRYRVYRCIFETHTNIAWKIKTRQEFAVLMGIDEKLADAYDAMEDAFQKKVAGSGLSAEKLAGYMKPYRRLDEFKVEREILINRIETMDRDIREKDRIIGEQQAFIGKLKRAIKNPFFAAKWAIQKAGKKSSGK